MILESEEYWEGVELGIRSGEIYTRPIIELIGDMDSPGADAACWPVPRHSHNLDLLESNAC